jgi:hypothetical protein
MRRQKRTKELVSQPVRIKKHVIKSGVVSKPSTNALLQPAVKRIKQDDFSFEAEIARFAHLNGYDGGPRFNPLDMDETELSVVLAEETVEATRDEPVSYMDNQREVIDKISRSQRTEEKEGWEAFFE